jgi:hypothetical protein
VNSETWDVFQDDDAGSNFIDHPEEVFPKPAFVFESSPLPGNAEGLAGDASSDAIHFAAPRLAVEIGKRSPDRSLIQGRVFHPRHEIGRCVTFPLNISDGAKSGPEDSESKLESSNSGTNSQAIHSPLSFIISS